MSDRIRIVHVTTVPESLGFLDGQIPYLQDRGFEFAAISSPGPCLQQFAARHGVEVVAIPMTRQLTPLADLRALMKLIRELRRLRPAIVHAHTPKAGLLGTVAGAIAHVPTRVYHLRGLPLLTAKGPRRALLRSMERISCAAATKVICVSHSLRDAALRERLCQPAKIAILAGGSGQGVDATGRFDPDRLARGLREATRAYLGIPDDAIVVGFLGRLVRDKGVIELVEAFEALAPDYPRLHLLVAGSLERRDSIPTQTIRAMDGHARIHRVNFDRDTPALYAAIDLVALPTYREGFPNVPLEAAAMRKPVVATRVTGCVDAVADGETGLLIPAGDPSMLARAIERYLVDPELRRCHGEAGRRRVVRSFQPEQIWAALHDCYRELAERAPRPVYAGLKRALDVAASAALLAVLAAPIIGIAAGVRATMGSPAIFSQARPGKGERLFQLYKFRTMTNARDDHGELLPDRKRITRFGAWLRRTSVDELPELWNVLKGEMSLVGPRPLLVRYLPYFTERERLRHSILPGITGWAQLHGRNQVLWDDRLALDVWYVVHRTLWLDLKILMSTLRMVLRREGVVVDPRSAMLNFDEERRVRAADAR